MDKTELVKWSTLRLILIGILYILYSIYMGGPDSHTVEQLINDIRKHLAAMDKLLNIGAQDE